MEPKAARGSERERAALARAAVAGQPFWYHTLELASGVVTPGWFDLRPIVGRMPWPDVSGKRCLDVGPYDGFLSFELERRGAREVVAADIGDAAEWDWPAAMRSRGPAVLREITAGEVGAGFRAAKEALGSGAERIEVSAYDLSPERVGEFDVVVCGSLMLHLRDPVRALEAIRSVCRERFLSAEAITPAPIRRRRAAADFRAGELAQWWIPTPAGHRRMLEAAGFEVERATRPYAIPFGPAHPPVSRNPWPRFKMRLAAGGFGVPHAAVLARPSPPPA